MLYRIEIHGISPLIQHSSVGINPNDPINIEKKTITAKKGRNRTESDDARLAELECLSGFWMDNNRLPTIPPAVLRANIETSARRLKQGALVREGLVVTATQFDWDKPRYGKTIEELTKSTMFSTSVRVQQQRLMRVRPKFDVPWSLLAEIDGDDELVDSDKISAWLAIGGRRVGLGDWRPEKSGSYGRYKVVNVENVSSS